MASQTSRYIGRVGALAFFLGVGVGVALSAPDASADSGAPDRSAGATAGPAASTRAVTRPRAAAARGTLFARRPTIAYNAAQNVQADDGVISGTLNASQRNGYRLSYSQPTPAKGTVAINSDGTFTYTPGEQFAAIGGTDTFTVTADDRPENPRHLHGLSTLWAPNGGHTATSRVTVLENPGSPIPTSVLGTTDQLDAERRAAQVAASPIVGLAKLIVKAGWMLAARHNYALIGGPDAANRALMDQALHEYATAAALQAQLLNSADPKVIQQVAPPHDWYLQRFPGSRIWYDNPDTIYRFIGVNSVSSYVITGQFNPDSDRPADTNFSVLTGLGGTTASNLNYRDMDIDENGNFTITVSSAPAAPGQRNHLQLVAGTTLITTRNTLSDWNLQDPMSLSVLKVSGPPPSLFSQLGGFAFPGIGPLVARNPLLTSLVSLIPPLPGGLLAQQVETAAIMMLLGITAENKYMGVAAFDPVTGQRRAPNTLPTPDRNAEFLSTQLQSTGYFDLADDEALVITVHPNSARYFTVPVTNLWTITTNYWDEQTSLSNAQAEADGDGGYTFVVSKTDPNVANWISTGGLNQGTISIRFQDFDPGNPQAPTVSAELVPLDQITPDYTPDERADQIAQRQLGYFRRYAPYPQA